MAQLEPYEQEMKAARATLAYIAAQKRTGFFKPTDFLEKNPMSFPLLLDEDRQVTKAYGVYTRLALDAYNIAHPATFVIGPDGMIRWIYVGAGQHDRSPVEGLLKAVREK